MKWRCIQLILIFMMGYEAFSLEKIKFKINSTEFSAQVAENDESRSKGLMLIKFLPQDEGMLFVFEEEQTLNFWMKNTLIDLSIAFINDKGIIVDIQEMTASESILVKAPRTYKSKLPGSLALEMNKNWFKKHSIKPGDQLKQLGQSKSNLLKSKPIPRQK
jgi:uncharacterized membrane protein (UPF0127 family)